MNLKISEKKIICTNCQCEATHIDNKGFIYCATHGAIRKQYTLCRKLTDSEIEKLKNDTPIDYRRN